ncbi:hypothetical protein SCHPADRAFT_52881 [Schizopora paradoxa]|uniref:Mid2 domain-containing protein n=1 Tax=Schizopora paradoxa TaxID=27342 RepID=A0A0H2S5W1_9AGAM|nr:hypothetical protein SCHPADRAFT_52881 [Schizopora paradoxa]
MTSTSSPTSVTTSSPTRSTITFSQSTSVDDGTISPSHLSPDSSTTGGVSTGVTTSISSGAMSTTSTDFTSNIQTQVVSGTGVSTNASSKGFFKNTAAVAGVFSVVGFICAMLVTTIIFLAYRRSKRRYSWSLITPFRASAEDNGAAGSSNPQVYYGDEALLVVGVPRVPPTYYSESLPPGYTSSSGSTLTSDWESPSSISSNTRVEV